MSRIHFLITIEGWASRTNEKGSAKYHLSPYDFRGADAKRKILTERTHETKKNRSTSSTVLFNC